MTAISGVVEKPSKNPINSDNHIERTVTGMRVRRGFREAGGALHLEP